MLYSYFKQRSLKLQNLCVVKSTPEGMDKAIWQKRFNYSIYFMLCLSGLFPTENRTHSRRPMKIIFWLLNFVIVVGNMVFNFSILSEGSAFVGKANFFMGFVAVIQRLILCSRIDDLIFLSKEVITLFDKLNIACIDKSIKWAYLSGILTLSMFLPFYVLSILSLVGGHGNFLLFGHISMHKLYKIALTSLYLFLMLLLTLPLSIFSTYYTFLCLNLKSIMANFSASLHSVLKHQAEYALRQYLHIRQQVEMIDSKISILMFTSSLYNASTMYFGVTAGLHLEEYVSYSKYAVFFLFATSLVAFISMALSASLVQEANSILSYEAHILLSDGKRHTGAQEQFLKITEKDLYMTMWKIFPLKRSFIMATIGTVFTYCILVENLQNSTM